MVAAFAGTATAGLTTSGNSVTIAKPANVADGDLLVAELRGSSSGATTDFACTGWSRSGPTFVANDAVSRIMGIYLKPVPSAAAEPSSYTFTYTGTAGRVSGQIKRVTGADLANIVQAMSTAYDSVTTTNGTTLAPITATGPGLLVILAANEVVSPNSSTPTTGPSGAILEGVSESSTGTGSTRSVTAMYSKAVTAGPTGTLSTVWASTSSPSSHGIIINPAPASSPPTAAFTHSETGLTTSVDGTTSTAVSPATIVGYDWDWGDSTTHGTGATATHTYRDAGTYTITLTVTDSNALTGTITHNATVARPPRLRLGTTELSRFRPGGSDLVAIYVGATKVRQLSHTIEEIQADANFYVAHRGFSSTFPEMTMYAYDQAFAWGAKAIEISVWPSADGTLWCSHSQNLSTLTGGVFPNNIDTYTDAQLASALVVVPSGTEVSGQTAKPLTKLSDVLAKYGTRQVIFIEDKTYSHASTLVPLITAIPGYQHRFIWKQDANGNPNGVATTAGIKTWGYLFYDEMSFFAGQQSKFDYFGLDYRCDDATCTSSIATAGASRVIGHVIPSQAQATRMLGFGVKGLMDTGRSFTPTNAVL